MIGWIARTALSLIPFKWYAVGAVMAASAVAVGVQTWRVHSLQRDVAVERLKTVEVARNRDQLKSVIELQNKAVVELSLRAEAAESHAALSALEAIRAGEARRRAIENSPLVGHQEMNAWLRDFRR